MGDRIEHCNSSKEALRYPEQVGFVVWEKIGVGGGKQSKRMNLSSVTGRPSLTSRLDLRGFCPPCAARTDSLFRYPLHSSKVPARISCQRRASSAGSDPQSSDGEDFFQKSDKSSEDDGKPEITIHDDARLTSSAAPGCGFSSSTSPVSNVAALQLERARNQGDLRETFDTLSRSLELLSSTLSEMSSAVRVLSTALGNTQLQAASSPSGAGYSEATERLPPPLDLPEPWDNAAAAMERAGSAGPVDNVTRRSEDDIIPSYLVEENERAHKLAYRLQQAFFEARIEGLGKPFQVAAEDFVQACMEAHSLGIGLKELQLQLVLQDGSLTGAFAIRNQRWSNDPILNEETRIRSLWVRLVYATLTQGPGHDEEEEVDPIDAFVRQVLIQAVEGGYDLARLKLEQAFSGPEVTSGAVKAMRENQYLILLSWEKSKSQR